ncbi:hypothetical protein DPMN_182521 [Dreissena polymorpha]|uniref:Protein kinase domain-containing protein n=1 Tax=Dreissena polymorpha TaxID=45954 RepID=A0A9D4DI90_DREPO|nr:hypothetical protein DPMN_182521 [Dreissena polymorpha]
MILASPMPYTKALEFDVHDVVQNYGEKKKVANGITAMVSFNPIDAKYIKLSKQYMEIKDHEGIIVIFTEEKGFEGQSVEGSQVIHFHLAEQAAITYLKRRLLDIHQFFVGTKTWIVLINDQLLHLGDNGTADNYNLDDLLSVKIFKSDDDNHSTLGMMFLVGKGREKQIKKGCIRTHSDILISIETATKMFCKVPLERQMCDNTASPFDGRIWLLDQQQYQLIVNYFPSAMDTREGIQDVTFFELSNKSVPGFRRKLFIKRCKVADDEDCTMEGCLVNCLTLFAAALNVNIRELLDEGLLNWQERVRVLYHVASAIAFLHRRRILHLDVTSMNIVVDESLNVRMTDFGSAKVLAAGEKQIKCADEKLARLGRTEGYMPAKVNLLLDKTVDYFNFGVVIRECLTGELPTRQCNCNRKYFLRQGALCWDFNKQHHAYLSASDLL